MKYAIGICLMLLGVLMILAGGIAQFILCAQIYGVIITDFIIIPHWTLSFLYGGIVPILIGYLMIMD